MSNYPRYRSLSEILNNEEEEQESSTLSDVGNLVWGSLKNIGANVLTSAEQALVDDWDIDDQLRESASETRQKVSPEWLEKIDKSGFHEGAELSLSGVAGDLIESGTSLLAYAPAAAMGPGGAALYGGAATAAMMGGGSYADTKEAILKLSKEELLESPVFGDYYREAAKLSPDNLGDAWSKAHESMAHDLARENYKQTGAIGALSGYALGPALANIFKGGKGIIGGAKHGAKTEAIQETVESGAESYGLEEKLAKVQNRDMDIGKVARETAYGATLGGITGGGAGAISGAVTPNEEQVKKPDTDIPAPTGDALDQTLKNTGAKDPNEQFNESFPQRMEEKRAKTSVENVVNSGMQAAAEAGGDALTQGVVGSQGLLGAIDGLPEQDAMPDPGEVESALSELDIKLSRQPEFYSGELVTNETEEAPPKQNPKLPQWTGSEVESGPMAPNFNTELTPPELDSAPNDAELTEAAQSQRSKSGTDNSQIGGSSPAIEQEEVRATPTPDNIGPLSDNPTISNEIEKLPSVPRTTSDEGVAQTSETSTGQLPQFDSESSDSESQSIAVLPEDVETVAAPPEQEVTEAQPDLIISSSGKPFSTMHMARTSAKAKGLKDYQVIAHGTGFAIKPANGRNDNSQLDAESNDYQMTEVPENKEVAPAEPANSAPESNEKLNSIQAKTIEAVGNVGDTVTPNQDFDYLKSGEPVTIKSISKKGEVEFASDKGSTIIKGGMIRSLVKNKGLQFDKVEMASAPEVTQEEQTQAPEREPVPPVEADTKKDYVKLGDNPVEIEKVLKNQPDGVDKVSYFFVDENGKRKGATNLMPVEKFEELSGAKAGSTPVETNQEGDRQAFAYKDSAEAMADQLRSNAEQTNAKWDDRSLKPLAKDIAESTIENKRRLTKDEIADLAKKHDVDESTVNQFANGPVGYDFVLSLAENGKKHAIAFKKEAAQKATEQVSPTPQDLSTDQVQDNLVTESDQANAESDQVSEISDQASAEQTLSEPEQKAIRALQKRINNVRDESSEKSKDLKAKFVKKAIQKAGIPSAQKDELLAGLDEAVGVEKAQETSSIGHNEQGGVEQDGRPSIQSVSSEESTGAQSEIQNDQSGSPSTDTGNVEVQQSEDVQTPERPEHTGGNGGTLTTRHVGGGRDAGTSGVSANGREGDSGERTSDAGTRGGRDRNRRGVELVTPAETATLPDFHISNPLDIVGGGQVARFNKNKAAIELYNELRDQGRKPTNAEQKILAGYTGWGSFGQELFKGSWQHKDPKAGWEERDEWLRDHLGQTEWESAQRSIINAHYTDPPTVMAMWKMVERLGFKGGRVLEPSMGIGNFFGMMPKKLKNKSKLTGIELDELTGGMAQMLYPNSNISIKGYEKSTTPDGFYDLVIGNWPFSEQAPVDRRYMRLNPTLHDYFFLKAIDQVRPGGLVVGITSKGTMDKVGESSRYAMAKKAELVAAYRLPSGAFEDYAGTKVVTDIIIFKKREKEILPDDSWIKTDMYRTSGGQEVRVNQYFIENQQNVLGTIDYGHGTTFRRPGLIVHRPEDMNGALDSAVDRTPKNVYQKASTTDSISYITNNTKDREGSITKTDKGLFVVRGEHLAPIEQVKKYALKDEKKTAKRKEQIESLIALRQLYGELIDAERKGGETAAARSKLNDAYEQFTELHGPVNKSYGLQYFKGVGDPFYPSLAALEMNVGTANKPKYEPAKVLSESTIRAPKTITNPSIADAYVLARHGEVSPNLDVIAEIAKQPEEKVKQELLDSGAVFEDEEGGIIPADLYLSGNVRVKLKEAKEAVKEGNTALKRNVEALEKVLPPDVPYHEIEAKMGATWVSPRHYADYVAHMLNLPNSDNVNVRFNVGKWVVDFPSDLNYLPEARAGFGTEYAFFKRVVNAAMSNTTITVKSKDVDGNEFVDVEKTSEVTERISKIREEFGEWIWSDPVRRVELEEKYNFLRNGYASPSFDGSFLNFDGMALELGNSPFNLRKHQVNAIWRALVMRKSLNAHEVGTGKTFTMGGIAVESRRYGIAKKPMIIAHNANSATVAAEIMMMYPSAKVLYIDNLSPKTIDVKLRQIANDDWDAVVIPHSLVRKLRMSEDTLMAMAREELVALEEEAREAANDDGVEFTDAMLNDEDELKKLRSHTAKDLVKMRNKIITSIQKQSVRSSTSDAVSFEELGVDMLLVDEAHEFKKPPIVTKMSMRGLNKGSSASSIALKFLTSYVRNHNTGGNVHLFTGTPITNTLDEIYHQMRYIMEDEMKEGLIDQWDGWFGSFASEVTDVELNSAGEYENVTRLASFVNVPELRQLVGQYMDVVFSKEMPEMKPRQTKSGKVFSDNLTETEKAELENGRTEGAKDRPYKKVIVDSADMTPSQVDKFRELQMYAQRWRNMDGKAKKEAMMSGAPESPIITDSLATKASYDMRLLDDSAVGNEGKTDDHENSKASRVVKNVLEVYNSHKKAGQVIFTETGYSKMASRQRTVNGQKHEYKVPIFSPVYDIVERLVQGGIPREQIAIVDGNVSKDRRKDIAKAMNKGTIRVVIGSTQTLGVGVNMQQNLRAMHHIDAPWRPGDLEQRNGRGHRQGNQWNSVLEYRYLTNRLDGRRWQVLAIKERFIKAFLSANSKARVIDGDAAAEDETDIMGTFSEAAGDPRILIREKLNKKLEKLRKKERMHTQAVADARRKTTSIKRDIARAEQEADELYQLSDAFLPGLESSRDSFEATINGKRQIKRKDAEKAINSAIARQVRVGGPQIELGTLYGKPLFASIPAFSDSPILTLKAEINGETKPISSNKASLASLDSVVRGLSKKAESQESLVEDYQSSLKRMEEVAKEPFKRADELKRTEDQLEALEQDLQNNPVPPPAWLRNGSPIDTTVYYNGNPFAVTGHRWTSENWYVLAEDEKGSLSIPYDEATDEQGIKLYESREFEQPDTIVENQRRNGEEGEAQAVEERAEYQEERSLSYGHLDPALQRQSPALSVKESLSDKKKGSIPREKALDIIDGITESWSNGGDNVQLVETVEGLPSPLVSHINATGIDRSKVRGVFFDGNVYLVRENLSNRMDVERALFHEGYGHFGLRQLMQEDLRPELRRLFMAIGGTKGFNELAKKYGIKLSEYKKSTQFLTRDEKINAMMDELLAHMAETNRPGVKRALNEFWGKLRQWLRNLGFLKLSTVSESELFLVLKNARRAIEGNETIYYDQSKDDIRFSAGIRVPVDIYTEAAWRMIGEDQASFRYPKTDKKDLKSIFAEISKEITVQKILPTERDKRMNGVVRKWEIISPDKQVAHLMESDKEIWIDVSRFKSAESEGSAVYAAVSSYAFNNDKVFIGDPDGLTDKGMMRRTEMMLSAALKYQSTDFMKPHIRQEMPDMGLEEWVRPIDWKEGEYSHNLRELLETSYSNIKHYHPEVEDVIFNFESGEFEPRTSNPGSNVRRMVETLNRGRGHNTGDSGSDSRPAKSLALESKIFGSTSIKRAVTTNTFLSRESETERGLVLSQSSEYLSSRPTDKLDEILYSIQGESDLPMFSLSANSAQTLENIYSKKAGTIVDTIKDWLLGNKFVTAARENSLALLTLRQLSEVAKKYLPQIKDYVDVVHKMMTDRNVMAEKAADFVDEWQAWASKNKKEADELANVMHDATLAGVDPSKPFVSAIDNINKRIRLLEDKARSRPGDGTAQWVKEIEALKKQKLQEPRRKKDWLKLKPRFDALSPEAQRLFQGVRDEYQTRSREFHKVLEQRIENAAMDGRIKKMLLAELRLEQESQEIDLYFPLARFGNYYIDAADPNGERVYLMFESEREQKRTAENMKKEGFKIEKQGRTLDKRFDQGANISFVNELMQSIDGISMNDKKSGEVRDAIYQTYLQHMPDRSIRKQYIHRKGVSGFSNDAIRAFADRMMKSSYQLARLKHQDDLTMLMDEMEKSAKTGNERAIIYNEMSKRHDWVMNPKNSAISQKLTSTGFIWMLGVSPAAAAVNLTQTPVVAGPVLGSKFGMTKAFKELASASRQFSIKNGSIKDKLTSDEEKQAYQSFVDMGLLDATRAHDLAGLAEQGGYNYSSTGHKWMNRIAFLFHKAEQFNREVTAMAAYRLGMEKHGNHDQAVKEAAEMTWDAHFDYTNINRARFMQGDFMKVAMQFKQYSQNITYYLLRNLQQSLTGATKKEKQEARRQLVGTLAMTGIIGGINALPLWALYTLATAIFDDDDEPFDARTETHIYLAELLGKDVADWVIYGAGGAGVSPRISLDGLWVRESNRDLEGEDLWSFYAKQAVGPVLGGIAPSIFEGIRKVGQGEYQRGFENMVPKFVKDVSKAQRYFDEGATTLKGDQLKEEDEFSPVDLMLQAMGIADSGVSKQYQENAAIKGYEQRILKRRQRLLTRYYQAWKEGDSKEKMEVLRDISRFNKANPKIRVDHKTLSRSVKTRQRYRERADHGVILNKKLERDLARVDWVS